jgi:hypothetical protein
LRDGTPAKPFTVETVVTRSSVHSCCSGAINCRASPFPRRCTSTRPGRSISRRTWRRSSSRA